MIEIDGSFGEGGGQIIRTSLALSALTQIPVRISNIRAKRSKPGLMPQHVTCAKALREICSANVHGAKIGSTKLFFEPNKIKGGGYRWKIGTAGSVPLVLQALMPPMIFSGENFSVEIIGGTNVKHSPTIDYFQHIFCWYLEKMGMDKGKLKFEVKRYGFFPKGGGRVNLRISKSEINPIEIVERGNFNCTEIKDSVADMGLKMRQVAERQVKGFKKEFKETKYGEIVEKYVPVFSRGSSIHAYNSYENCRIGASALGERDKIADDVGATCAKLLKKEIDADSTLDTHMLDQIVPYMAMIGGKFKFKEMTEHTRTNIYVTEKFLPVKFKLNGNVIECKKQ